MEVVILSLLTVLAAKYVNVTYCSLSVLKVLETKQSITFMIYDFKSGLKAAKNFSLNYK